MKMARSFAILVFLMGLFNGATLASEATIFGPYKYLRNKGKPNLYNNVFSATEGEGILIVTNGDENGKHRISSATITINGEKILGTNDFNQNVYVLDVPLSLSEINSISVKLKSKPGSYLTIEIVQAETGENEPPVADAGPDQTALVGDTVTLDGSGSSDVDGDPLDFTWSFVSTPLGSSATLSDPLSVNPTFDIDLAGTYVIQLIVNDGTVDSAPDTVTITTENSPPVADAGPDRTTLVGNTVTLDGSGSSDVDGDPLDFSWSFVSTPLGSSATLSDPTSVNPTFDIDLAGTYVVQLIVNDGTVDSSPDTVTITTENSPPVADAGPDQTALVGDTVTLDASGSSDVDGDLLDYFWSFISTPPGSGAALSDPTSVNPTFDIDLAGTYVVQLIVNDGTVDSAPDTVTITTENTTPVADAGPDQTVLAGDTVNLDGSGSFDADGDPLDFTWSFASIPPGSGATISDPTATAPTFVADLPGTYVVQLIVNDGTVDSAPDTVTITTENTTPVADAGPDQTVLVGDTVNLDGSGSFDADGDPLDFTWSFASIPPGSGATLSDPTAVAPTFVADLPGTYVVQLIVNDGTVDSAPDTVTITTENSPPLATDDNYSTDEDTTLNVAAPGILGNDTDPDGDPLTAILDSDVSNGILTLNADGSFTYTPNLNFNGTDSFTYYTNDGGLDSNIATVTINVIAVNDAPVAEENTYTIDEDTPLNVSAPGILANDTDPDGNPLTAVLDSDVSNGTLTLKADGSFTYNPSLNFNGTDSFTYHANDGGLDSNIATVTIEVTPVNDPPTADAGSDQTVFVGATVALDGSGSSDPDGDSLTYLWSFISKPTGSSAAFSDDTAVDPSFTADFDGIYEIRLIVNDATTDSAPSSCTVTVTLQGLNLILESPIVGVERSINGVVELSDPAPAGGVTVTLASDDADIATIEPSTLFIPEGEYSAPVTVNGIAIGTTTLTANATGFDQATADIEVTNNMISIASGLVVAPGQTSSLATSLTTPAPPGGLTVNLSSSDEGIATVSASIFFPEGEVLAPSNPQVTGITIGVVEITAKAIGFAPDTRDVTVTLDISFSPTTLKVVEGSSSDITLHLSAAAPAGGLTINLSTDDTGVATVPATVIIDEGETSTVIAVSGISIGSTTLRASAPNISETTATINVTPPPPITIGNNTIGKNLQVPATGYLGAPAPAGGVVVTITSADPTKVLLSTDASLEGSGSITRTVGAGSSSIPGFYVQALDGSGTVDITLSAPGYADGTSTVTMHPSGFYIYSPSFSTTTFSANKSIQIRSARLNPTTLNVVTYQNLRGGLTVDVDLTNSDDTVGTLTINPVVFNPNDLWKNTEFDPLAAGTSDISVLTPAGFDTPNNYTTITATVTAPNISIADVTVGEDLQQSVVIYLGATPPSPVEVTVTVASGTIATISDDPLVEGSASLTFTGVSNASVGTIYVQGRSQGTTTITVQASGYNDGSSTVTVHPSGFYLYSPSFSTTTFSANHSIQIRSARLNPSTLNVVTYQNIRGGLTVNVELTNSDDTVGTLTINPLEFGPNDLWKSTQFDPLAAGTSDISVVTPAGFDTPSNYTTITATVTAPNITIANATVGEDLQQSVAIYLGATPPSPVDVTVTVASGTIATISDDPLVEGSASLTFTGVSGTSVGTIYVQGRSQGTTTITVQTSGYNDGSSTVTVHPSGFYLYTNSFTTTTFSPNKSIQIRPARLNPSTLNVSTYQNIRGGLTVNVDLTNSDNTVGTLTTNPVVFGPNDVVKYTEFDPLVAGTTDISVVTPAGFDTPSNYTTITATVTAPDISIADATVGEDLQQGIAIYLEVAPPSPVDVTVTIAAGSIATISDDPLVEGSTSLTFTGISGISVGTIYVQGRSLGTTTIKVQASGYNDGDSNVTVHPSGFYLYSGSFSTTVSSPNKSLQIRPARLHPTTLNVSTYQNIRGGLTVNVNLTNSDDTVGTIAPSTLAFGPNDLLKNTEFDPLAVGTTDISVLTPAGFDTPSNYTTITATVNP